MIALTSCQHFPYSGQDLLWYFHFLYFVLLLSRGPFLKPSLCIGLKMSLQTKTTKSCVIHCPLPYGFLLASSGKTQASYPVCDRGKRRCPNCPRNPITQNRHRCLFHFQLSIIAFHSLLLSAFSLWTVWTRLGDISNQHLYRQAATGLFASLQPSVSLHCLSVLEAHSLDWCSLQTGPSIGCTL